jgi:hypothetical protein
MATATAPAERPACAARATAQKQRAVYEAEADHKGKHTPAAERPASRMVTRHEILSTEDRDGERSYRYRWTHSGLTDVNGKPMEDLSGEDWARSPIEPLPRVIMEDRWTGLLRGKTDTSKLQERLDQVLIDLVEGVIRRSNSDAFAVVDGEVVGVDEVMDVDGIEDVIREWILERAPKVALR